MKWTDISHDPRVAEYDDLFLHVAAIDDPELLLRTVIDGMAHIQGPRGYIRLATYELPPGHFRITRFTTDDGEELVPPDQWGADLNLFPVQSGGFLSEVVSTPLPKLVPDFDLKDDPILGARLAHYRCAMAIKLYTRLEPGDWLVILTRQQRAFSTDNIPDAIMRGNLIGGVLENLTIARKLRKVQERIQYEVDQIAEMERSLLFDRRETIPGWEIAASYATFDRAGGDYFRFMPLQGGRHWLVFIADAAGHGASAAVIVAMMHALLGRLPQPLPGPGAALEYLNDYFNSVSLPHRMITAFCGVYEPRTGLLRYARAGHDIPLHRRANDASAESAFCDVEGFPLGVVAGVRFVESNITLRPDDLLLFYTDGITEARSPEGDLFGLDRLQAAFTSVPPSPQIAIDSLKRAVSQFEAGTRSSDDQMMIACRVASTGA